MWFKVNLTRTSKMGLNKGEISFPRGRSSTNTPALRRRKNVLFNKQKKLKKKTKSKVSFYEDIERKLIKQTKKQSSDLLQRHIIKPLTYQALEEGMVVLCRIREISQYHMFVCLPGRLSAKVTMTAISIPYTDSLAKLRLLEITQKECPPLNELFRVGQVVVCSVQEVNKEGELLAVSASLEPSLVNRDRGHHNMRAGSVVVAAVRSEEDHGYTLHTGISGLTAFLRRSQTLRYIEQQNLGRPLVVGEVLRCLVTKCVTSQSTSRVEVTVDPRALARAVLSDITSQTLQPAATVHCTVEKVLSSGLVVTAGKGKAYIEATQMANCWSLSHDYEPGQELTASVLYVLPQSDFQAQYKPTYLTLKNITDFIVPKINIGDVFQAVITSSTPKGVYLCLGQDKDNEIGNKGFVSIRRLGENIGKNEVSKHFPQGKLVTTRVLAFDFMEQVYNCSLERDKLEQQYVKMEQLHVGNRVTCQITEVEDIGLKMALGPIRLYTFKEHSADVPYSNLHQHFVVGDIVDARVLKVNPESRQVLATLKETLIRSPILSSYDAAKLNDCYWGTVRLIRDTYLYITFYNDVAGTLRLTKPHPPYFPGQLVKCYISYVNVQEEKLMLSLTPSQPKEPKQVQVGEQYLLVVTDVSDHHLTVSACDHEGIMGIIPKSHLQDQEARQEGDFLKAWLYMKKLGKYYFSPKPTILEFLKAEEFLKPNSKITCCVGKISVKSKNIKVYTSLADFPVVNIPKSNWFGDRLPEEHTIVQLYVENINRGKRYLKLISKKRQESLDNAQFSQQNSTFTEIITKPNVKETKKQLKKTKMSEGCVSNKDGFLSCCLDEKRTDSSCKEQSLDECSEYTTCHKKKRKDSSSIEEIEDFSAPNKKKTLESEPSKFDQKLALGKTEDVNRNKKTKRKKEKENKSVRTKINNATSEEILPRTDVLTFMPVKNTVEKDPGEPQISGKKISGKRKMLEGEHVNDTSKRKNSKLENVESDSVKPTLTEIGFLWDVKPEDLGKPEEDCEEDNDEDVDDSTKNKKKKSAADRRRAAKEEEARLREVEKTLLDSESNPQSADQFDRAVLARPDVADLWIKYMSHHLQATEIEKARAVARRALQTINQRHEVERFNVWIALLNLDHLFGTQESLKNTLNEALRSNDEFTVYCKMLQIYSQANKPQEAEQLVGTMLRKFRDSAACWEQSLSALMSCQLPDKARNLLQRAISALPSREHVNLLCKFALMENQHGFSEQAQTLFEHILTSYPKRTDIWNVYVDMLVKSKKIEVARKILERATRQKLPARKMKMLFSKWVSFEEKHGTSEKVEHVRKQALAYVNNITKNL